MSKALLDSKKVHFQDILDQLEAFEKENEDWIISSELYGWNDWFLLKKNLFYTLKNKNYNLGPQKQKQAQDVKLKWFIEELASFCKLFFWIIIKRGGDAIITATSNKLSKDEEGYYQDVFVDPLIQSGVIEKYLYIEYSSAELIQRKSKIRAHNKRIGRNPFIIILGKLYSRKLEVKTKSIFWANKLNDFFKKNNSPINLNADDVLYIFSNFFSRYHWYLLLWRILKPKRLFCVDAVPDGSLAAALKLNIKIFEFQHGFVSNTKPDYIINPALLECKNKLVLPNYICVYGDYFKELLTQNNFWKKDQIISLGSYVVAKQRQLYNYQISDKGETVQILWTTQPTMFLQTKTWLQQLSSLDLSGFKFFLKNHPLEPVKNKEWYQDFVIQNSRSFQIEENINLFNALTGKHMLIGFHSTTLLEGTSLGVPVITLATEQYPEGILSMLNINASDVIKPVTDLQKLSEIIAEFRDNPSFAKAWSQKSYELGHHFFASNYIEKINRVFSINDNNN